MDSKKEISGGFRYVVLEANGADQMHRQSDKRRGGAIKAKANSIGQILTRECHACARYHQKNNRGSELNGKKKNSAN